MSAVKNKKQFGIWMDSHHATIVGRENIDNGDFLVLAHVKNDTPEGFSSEHTANNSEKTLLLKFFKEITAHMQNVDEVYVTGTGTAQEQFIHYLEATPQYKHAAAKESTLNKMNDEKLVEYFTAKFN